MKNYLLFIFSIFWCLAGVAQCDNVALGKPVTASNFMPCCAPQNAVDGDCALIWNAGNYATQYIEVDLLSNYTINNINIMFEMTPNGNVNHEILTSPDMVTWTVADVATGFYITGQLIERCYSSAPLSNVRGVRINSLTSPSWISIREMGIYSVSTPTITTISASGPLTFCQGQSVTLTSSAAYAYLWSTGETTQSITVSSSGTYTVTTEPAPLCTKGTTACTMCGSGTATASVTVTVNPLPVLSVAPVNPSICAGSSQVLTASGAITYTWSPVTNLSAGTGASVTANPPVNSTYTVTGTDAQGCINTAAVSLTVNQKPTVSVSAGGQMLNPPPPICAGNSETLTATGALNYTWSPASGLNSTTGAAVVASPTVTTTYTVTGTNASNCSNVDSIVITISNLGATATIVGDLLICSGNSSTLTASGGGTYLWKPGASTNSALTITPVIPTTYTVVVTNAGGCKDSTTATVNLNPLPVVSVSPANPSICIGSSQILTASGATTYTWSPATNLSANTGASVTANPPSNSTYTVTGTDAFGCVNTAAVAVTVNQKPLVSISAGGNPLCDSTKFNWTAWSSVNATSLNGTISSDLSVIVTKPTGGLSTTPGMFNGGVFPTQYDVPANSTAIRNDLAGLFTFCFNRPVGNPQVALSSIGNSSNSVQINTSDPYLVIWNGLGMSYPNNTSLVGTEGFTIIQFPGIHTCISFDYLQSETYCNIAFGSLDTNCQIPNPPPMCAGYSDTLTASGALNYSWSPAAGLNTTTGAVVIATPNVTTTYTVTGTDINNCSNTDSIVITISSSPNATVIGDTLICLGDSSTLTAAGGGTYLWMPGNSTNSVLTVGPLTPTTYTVTVTNAGGCKDSAMITVNVNSLPQAQFNLNAVCKTQPMAFNDVSIGSISSRTWFYGDGIVSTLQNTSHIYATCDTFSVKLVVSTAAGCKDSITKTATVHCLPVADFSSSDVCKGLLMNFTDLSIATDDSVTQWSWNFGDNSSLSVVQNASHTYSTAGTTAVSLIVTSNNGCKDSISKNVIVYPLPIAKFNTANVCDGEVASFNDISTVSAPSTLQSWNWDFGDGSPVNSNQNTSHLYTLPGSYSVELLVATGFGCVDSITNTVQVFSKPVVTFTATDTAGCDPLCMSFQGQSVVAGGTAALWSWNVGDGTAVSTSQNFDHCYSNPSATSAADYTVALTVTSDSGCVTTKTNNNYITVYPIPRAAFVADPSSTTITNPVISLNEASAGAAIWAWDFGDMDTSFVQNPPPHTYADTGTFKISLFVANQYSCADSTYQNIVIKPQFVFYIPNAFTPNNDLNNKTFSGTGVYIKEYEMMIFDRWGNLLYVTDDLEKPWDGTIKGGKELAQQDVYVYSIKVIDFKKDQHYYRGTVSLIR